VPSAESHDDVSGTALADVLRQRFIFDQGLINRRPIDVVGLHFDALLPRLCQICVRADGVGHDLQLLGSTEANPSGINRHPRIRSNELTATRHLVRSKP